MSTTPYPLGRHVQHDERSRGFRLLPALAVGIPPLPAAVMHRHYGPKLDQGNTSSCTGQAFVNARNSRPIHRTGEKVLGAQTAMAVYTLATQIDQFPGQMPQEDTGSSGLAACRAAVQLGHASSYRWAFGFEEMLAALVERPVMCGTNWYEAMFTPAPDGVVEIGGQVAGGHEWCALGYSFKRQAVKAINSWGKDWGVGGYFWVPFTVMRRLLDEQGDVVAPLR